MRGVHNLQKKALQVVLEEDSLVEGWNGYFVDDVNSGIFSECIAPRLMYNIGR